MASVWGELKRRNVVRVGIAYAIASWLILQLSNILVPLLALPAWADRFVLLVLVLGFPLALFFAWAFELTPDGLRKEKDVDRAESVTHVTRRKLDVAIIAVLAAALIFFVSKDYFLTPDSEPVADVVEEAEVAGAETGKARSRANRLRARVAAHHRDTRRKVCASLIGGRDLEVFAEPTRKGSSVIVGASMRS